MFSLCLVQCVKSSQLRGYYVYSDDWMCAVVHKIHNANDAVNSFIENTYVLENLDFLTIVTYRYRYCHKVTLKVTFNHCSYIVKNLLTDL